jgi:hypothetical protein
MNLPSKKKPIIVFIFSIGIIISILFSCVESKMVQAKSGAQLWAENCQRCHNTPTPNSFSAEQWKTIGMHMQSRALLTTHERDKIVLFLQQSN